MQYGLGNRPGLCDAERGVPDDVTIAPIDVEPKLPAPHGPLSTVVRNCLSAPAAHTTELIAPIGTANAYDLDLQLALYLCYELHYRGFSGVDPTWEWNPELLRFRAQLERAFLAALHRDIKPISSDTNAITEMESLAIEPVDATGVSVHLRDTGTWEQMCEYFIHRSLYQLKEGDPQAWMIPRLTGQAKAALVAVEFDEYGAGRGPRIHQQLFAELMAAAGLDAAYLGYLDAVPAETLAAANLMSLFGLHRRWRGAAAGHFASTEITSPPGAGRLVSALHRMQAPPPCIEFYREHVEADAVHDQVVRDIIGDLIAHEPHVEHDVVFGIRARDAVEDRLSELMLNSWQAGRSSLRRPLF